MKYTAIAPANIALIKYWGKKDEALRLPLNSSISMNLSNCLTTTTVEFSEKHESDEIIFLPSVILGSVSDSRIDSGQARMTDKEEQRVIKHLDRIRKLTKISLKAKVVTQNSFPSSAGIASSASGFAALTMAACSAAGLKLSEKELTILARIGSGSACRSIPDGFVEWSEGESNETSYAHSIFPANYWDLRDIILVVEKSRKKVGSTVGMENVWSSPLMKKRLETLTERIKKIKTALAKKDFKLLGEAMEADCLSMHAVMQSQVPSLFYWTKETLEIIKAVYKARENGLMVFFTIDAGPNVHVFCEGVHEKDVVDRFKKLFAKANFASQNNSLKGLIVNKPAVGARISEKDLF